MKRTCLTVVGALAMLGVPAGASAALIDFEGGPYGNGFDLIANSPGLPTSGSGLTFSVSGSGLGSDTAMVFDTTNADSIAIDPDLAAPFTDIDTMMDVNPGNIAVIGNFDGAGVDDTLNPGTITFTLSGLVDFVSFRVFDVGDNTGNLDIEYFDAGNNSLGTMNVGGLTGDNETQLINFGATGAKIASFTFGGSGGIDDIRFTVPVPGTLALFAAALLGAGLGLRRRA